MECRRCASPLDRPGDFCLVCRTPNTDAVLVETEGDEIRVVSALDGEVVGERVVKTRPHDEDPEREVTLRNLVGRAVDEVRRKRPEDLHVRGDRETVSRVRDEVHLPVSRVEEDASYDEVFSDESGGLEVVDAPVSEKVSGKHSTLIGGRDGRRAVRHVAEHAHVKKVIPGPIDASGRGSQDGFGAKVTRADENGNLRLLFRDGSSVQENRLVTTAGDRDAGERVRQELDELLDNEGF